MSRDCGSKLTPALLAALDRGAIYLGGGKGLPVLTVDAGGWPHVTIVAGAVAVAEDRLRFPVGVGTSSLGNLERDGRVTLLVADAGLLSYVKGEARVIRPRLESAPHYAACELAVRQVLDDVEEGLRILSGIAYSDPAEEASGNAKGRAALAELASF